MKYLNFYTIVLLITALMAPNVVFAANTSELLNLSDKINDKKEQLKSIEENLNYFKQKIDEARQKSVTLKNQIELTDNHIKKTELEIQEAEIKIDQTGLGILSLNSDINDAKKKIELQKDLVIYYLREVQKIQRKSPLEIFLLHPTFSKFFNQINSMEALQNSLGDSIEKLKAMQSDLEKKQAGLKGEKDAAMKIKNKLEGNRAKLQSQKTAKSFLIGETFASEARFQALLMEEQKEQNDLNAEIGRLESEAQNKLKESEMFPRGGDVVLTWPVTKNEITTYFHDPDYPYRFILGEHAGLDIRAAQGTPIAAPAPGYVLKVRDSATWREYSYVIIAHAGGTSTVYIHLSRVYVKADTYVSRGQIIGLTGGTPRTRGAGLFTTGPHLHFEVRVNGIPTNPFDYLVDF